MLIPGTMRWAPTMTAVGGRAVMRAVGRPRLSSSFAIAAPQRVPVPQVEVKMTAETPSFLRVAARSLPILTLSSMGMATPVVV